MKIFVSNDISEKGVALLREHFDVDVMPNMKPEELIKVINNYDGLVTRSMTKVTKEVIEASTRLKVIGRAGVGVDNIDIPAATAKGIVVLNTPEGNTMAATEHTVAMMMAMTRHIPQAHQSIQEGKWDRKSFDGIQVQGKTLGIIGVGRIGSRIAKRMQAMEMKTIGYDPYIPEERFKQLGVEQVDLDTLLKRSDYITMHTPLTKETRGLIGKEEIAKMKDGVMIINTGRGLLIHTNALIEGLKTKKVSAAGLDVYEEEGDYFYEDKSDKIIDDDVLARLLSFNNVIVTSHQAFFTKEALHNIAETTLRNIKDFEEGRPLVNEVTK